MHIIKKDYNKIIYNFGFRNLNSNGPTVLRQPRPKLQKMGCGFHNHLHQHHRDEFDGRLLDFSYPEVVLVSGLSTTTTSTTLCLCECDYVCGLTYFTKVV